MQTVLLDFHQVNIASALISRLELLFHQDEASSGLFIRLGQLITALTGDVMKVRKKAINRRRSTGALASACKDLPRCKVNT